MKILSKYMLREFIKPFLAAVFIFLILFILSEAFRIINKDDKTVNALIFLPFYLLYQTPFWLTQILPISLLLAFLFSYSNLSTHNEVTAVKAGGININALFIPLILLSIFVSLGVLLANELVIPYTNVKANYFYRVKILGGEITTQTNYKNIVYIGEDGRKYVIDSYNVPTASLNKINIDKFNKNIMLDEQIYAQSAKWENQKWTFQNGVIRKFDPTNNNVIDEKNFKSQIIDLPETPENFKTETKKTDQMTIHEINKYVNRLEKNSIPAYKERSQMYLKFAFPFANTIVILIGIAFASSNFKANKIISFAVSIAISFLYWGITSVSMALGENRVLSPIIAAWITNLIFVVISGYFIAFKMKR